MLQPHRQRGALITIAIRPEPLPLAFGVVQADSKGRIIRFHEKPTQAELFSNWINCGIYLVEPGFLKSFPMDTPLSFEREVFPSFAESRKRFYGFPLASYWRDIGTPSSYLQAHEDFLDGKLPKIYYKTAQQRISENRTLLGARIRIDGGCRIEHSFIGDGCIIEQNAGVHHSVIWEDARIGGEAVLEHCIVANGAQIGSGAHLFEQAITAPSPETPTGKRTDRGLLTGGSKLDHEFYPAAAVQAA
jgi:NDP-sugar pyrophosphorylase family protein